MPKPAVPAGVLATLNTTPAAAPMPWAVRARVTTAVVASGGELAAAKGAPEQLEQALLPAPSVVAQYSQLARAEAAVLAAMKRTMGKTAESVGSMAAMRPVVALPLASAGLPQGGTAPEGQRAPQILSL